jgi:hypothetical protein
MIDMPRNTFPIHYNETWTFEFQLCNDNNVNYALSKGHVIAHEYFADVDGSGAQFHTYDWWAKGTEVRDNGTDLDYRSVDYVSNQSGDPPPTDYTLQPYTFFAVPANACKPMYWERPGGQAPGYYMIDVFIDQSEPISSSAASAGRIVLNCPPSFDMVCDLSRD